ncbi:hypothetical protein ACFLUU_09065 [Chloroflexota bacterium]
MKRLNWAWLLLVLMGVIGVSLVLISTSRYGSGIEPDSVEYISVARGLLSGEGFVLHDLTPYITGPPLFPSLLALVGLGGIDPIDSARFINAAIFGLIVFLTGFWLLKTLDSLTLALLGSIVILLSAPLIGVSSFILTEALFILLVLLFIFETGRFLKSGNLQALFLSAIITALIWLTRYAGVTVLLTGLVLLLFRRNTPIKSRLINGTVFGLIATLPIAIWVLRNYFISSTFVGPRQPPSDTFIESIMLNIYLALSRFSQFLLPKYVPDMLRILVFSILFILVGVIIVYVVRHKKDNTSFIGVEHLIPLLTLVIVYVGFYVISSAIIKYDPINDRLLCPAYIPLVFIVMIAVKNASVACQGHRWKHTVSILLLVFFCIWLTYPALRVTNFIQVRVQKGFDFVGGEYIIQEWIESELIHYLREHTLQNPVFSNSPEPIFIFTGMRTRSIPRKYPINDFLEFKEFVSRNEFIYVIWSEYSPKQEKLYDIQELRSIFDMELVVKCSDGAVYLVK